MMVRFGKKYKQIVLPSNFYHNVVSMRNVLYVYTDGKLMQSTDAKLWTIVANVSLQQLLGASSNKLYASSKQAKIIVCVAPSPKSKS